jgi:predicted ATPase with chaperone activity
LHGLRVTRVISARSRQRARYTDRAIWTNAQLTPSLMTQHCALDAVAADHVAEALQFRGVND